LLKKKTPLNIRTPYLSHKKRGGARAPPPAVGNPSNPHNTLVGNRDPNGIKRLLRLIGTAFCKPTKIAIHKVTLNIRKRHVCSAEPIHVRCRKKFR